MGYDERAYMDVLISITGISIKMYEAWEKSMLYSLTVFPSAESPAFCN